MSIQNRRTTGQEVIESKAYRRLYSTLCLGGACSLSQAARWWPDYDWISSFRDKKHTLSRQLDLAEKAGGEVRCFSALLPASPLVGSCAVARLPLLQAESADFEAIAAQIIDGIPAQIKFDRNKLFTVNPANQELNKPFECITEAERGWCLDRSRLGWFLKQAPLSCLINLVELSFQLHAAKRFAIGVTTDPPNLSGYFCPTEPKLPSAIGRPYAHSEVNYEGRCLFILGAGLTAGELRDACKRLASKYGYVPDEENESWSRCKELIIEIW